MQSFLLLAQNTSSVDTYLKTFSEERQISHFDIRTISFDEESSTKKNKQSIGIAEIKQIQKVVYLTPGYGSEKIVIIKDAQLLTSEAQNALLKLLEEPPSDTYLFLISPTKESFLPTILSRCFIVEIEYEAGESEECFLPETLSEVFELAEQKSKSKEESLLWLGHALLTYEKKLYTMENKKEIGDKLSILQQAYTTIKGTNVSPRLTLENTFLSLLSN